MALTSSSSLPDAIAQYQDNLSWEGSATKAAAALEALRFIQLCRPEQLGQFEHTLRNVDLSGEVERLSKVVGAQSANSETFVRGRPRML